MPVLIQESTTPGVCGIHSAQQLMDRQDHKLVVCCHGNNSNRGVTSCTILREVGRCGGER